MGTRMITDLAGEKSGIIISARTIKSGLPLSFCPGIVTEFCTCNILMIF